jgi:DNA-binding NtrC family response regulator
MRTEQAKSSRTILIVEDDSSQLSRYLDIAREAGFASSGARTEEDALGILHRTSVQYVLTDIHLNGQGNFQSFEGLNILRFLQEHMPEVVPLAMTSDPKIKTYDEVLKAGAEYLFRKPIINKDELLIHLNAARSRRLFGRLASRRLDHLKLPENLRQRCQDGVVIPDTIRETVRKIAAHGRVPVVINGETGTGKEEIAKLIHRRRTDVQGPLPFVAVNCANISAETAVSVLFGHKKGAFTGATETTSGYVGDADGGILFLDEIHALSMDCQQRLLRVLNDGRYFRLGESRELYSEFQVVVATTKDLDDEVDDGRFLLDLRNRLIGFDISLSPLRDRKEDLPILVELCFARHKVSVPFDEIERIANKCGEYYWRGNIRQLFMVLQALIVSAEGDTSEIRAENLPVRKHMLAPGDDQTSTKGAGVLGLPSNYSLIIDQALKSDRPLQDSVGEFEKLVIQAAMARHAKLGDVASSLGIGRSTLDEKRKKYCI